MTNPHDTGRPERGGGKPATGDLAARIARAREQQTTRKRPADAGGTAMTGANRAFRLASEFVAAIIVGAGLGYGIDMIFGTKPWGLAVLLVLGFIAGVVNIVRASADMNAATAVPPGTPAAPDDEDDET
jgi:ATP synthase protein I